jgi:hypothetical protein
VVEDMLMDAPAVTLNQAIKWFIHEEGGQERRTSELGEQSPVIMRVLASA